MDAQRTHPPPTYAQVVAAFMNGQEIKTLLNSCTGNVNDNFDIIDPVALLQRVAKHVRLMAERISPVKEKDMRRVPPFMYSLKKNQFVDKLVNCKQYPDIIITLYSGIFSCDNKQTVDAEDQRETPYSNIVTDVDLLCVFVAMVSLKRDMSGCENATREKLYSLILKSLTIMKNRFRDQWTNWPFTRLAGGNKMRDERTFNSLLGFDFRNGRKNEWISVTGALYEYAALLTDDVVSNGEEESEGVRGTTKVYAGRPVYDLFDHLPSETDELLFGEKLANTLRFCYNYSVSNMPFVLASDTHPVIGSDFPAIIPSGCCKSSRRSSPPEIMPTDNMTLVSRHAIPSTRKLGIFLLNRDSTLPPLNNPLKDLGRAIAECMVYSSINDEDAVITCPDSEIKCVERHISMLINRNKVEHCGLCNEKLNFEPSFDHKDAESAFDYFPIHAFMDTFEAPDKDCSASLCPDCVIRTVLFTYEKVSSASVAISDAFRCPCCDEYMINWLGRASEVSKLCRRTYPSSDEKEALKDELLKRIESCFSSLEMLQNDFMNTSLSSRDFFYSKEPKFEIRKKAFRPPVRRYKLSKGDTSIRYSLNCIQCVSPLCCDKPDEYLDIETVDAVPLPYSIQPVDVEDMGFDDMPTDEMLRYDDGPGTHRWPARLSCGFVSSNTLQSEKKIETCAEAIALLGRIPKKKRRGWSAESSEGKAIIALANWCKENRPPQNMRQLLTAVSSAFQIRSCFCVKANHHPFLPLRKIDDGVFSTIQISDHPLVEAYFKLRHDQQGGKLMEYAGLFTRNVISECLLQMPECIFHRASSFVQIYADFQVINEIRPDEAARLNYVKSLNISRRNLALGNSEDSTTTYTAKQERTVEWTVEQGGRRLKIVKCFNCKTAAIKRGGCVTMRCGVCQKFYCWLCEEPALNSDHVITEHSLFYSSSNVARKAFEDLYKVQITTLQLYNFEGIDMYVMEDGFCFDVSTNRAIKCSTPNT